MRNLVRFSNLLDADCYSLCFCFFHRCCVCGGILSALVWGGFHSLCLLLDSKSRTLVAPFGMLRNARSFHVAILSTGAIVSGLFYIEPIFGASFRFLISFVCWKRLSVGISFCKNRLAMGLELAVRLVFCIGGVAASVCLADAATLIVQVSGAQERRSFIFPLATALGMQSTYILCGLSVLFIRLLVVPHKLLQWLCPSWPVCVVQIQLRN